jgi:hypothetical protein
LLVAVLLSGCGGDEDSSASGGAPGNGGSGGSTSGGGGSAGSAGSGAVGGSTGGSGGSAGGATCTPSGQIVLPSGETTVSNLCITSDDKGIEGGNDTTISKITVTNVTIDSVNYGVYLGNCQEAIFDHVDITTDPQGGDSYSVRGAIASFTSSNSVYRAEVKAFRIYNLTGGSSTGDSFIGGRLMLGGGAASEWENPLPFQSFTFNGGSIDVESVEIYDATNNVTFNGVDFVQTNHISIQFGAHDLTFASSLNLPEIRYYDASGSQYTPDAAELASRNIVITP